jgi:hypothetical protein
MPSFDQVFRQFENRKRYERLTLEILESTPEEQLEQVLLDFLEQKLGAGYSERTASLVAAFPSGLQVYYFIHTLEAEVNNGGYNQYFFNPSGLQAGQALESLRRIESPEHLLNLEKAIALHEQEAQDPRLHALYAQRNEEAFMQSYELTGLGKIDDEFYALLPQLRAALRRFIRAHLEEFVT